MGLSNQYRADRHEQLCLSMKTSKGSISLPIDASAQSFSVKPPWSYGHGQASIQDLHVKWEGLTISVAIDGAIVSPSLFTRADT